MPNSPYPGFRPFEVDEGELFFGRNNVRDALLEELIESRFVAVIGPSGCGKSSLVNAGVMTCLEDNPQWRTVSFRPGKRPFTEFVRSLLNKSSLKMENLLSADEKSITGMTPFIKSILEEKNDALSEILDEICLTTFSSLLIYVDQLDEIFRYGSYCDQKEVHGLISYLLSLANQEEWPIHILVSIRSDYLGECIQYPGLLEAINSGQFITSYPSTEDLEEAILQPAIAHNAIVEPALISQFLSYGSSYPHHFPLFQHTLLRMWNLVENGKPQAGKRTLTVREYEKVGGLEHALSQHADEVFSKLDPTTKKIAHNLFRVLCENNHEQKDPRRPVTFGELMRILQVSSEQLLEVIDIFQNPDRNFIQSSPNRILSQDTIIDISHECLIWKWNSMKQWVEREKESAEIYRRLEQTARFWKAGKAALLGPLDLENINEWKNRENPNSAWSERYGGNFDIAMQFLEESTKKVAENQKKAIFSRNQESWRTRKQVALVFGSLAILYLLFAWGMHERDKAKQKHEQFDDIRGQLKMAMKKTKETLVDVSKAKGLTEAEKSKANEALSTIQQFEEKLESEIALRLAAEQATKEAEKVAKTAERLRQTDLFEFQLIHARLTANNGDYFKANEILNRSRKLDKNIGFDRINTRNLLSWYTQTIGDTPEKSFADLDVPIKAISMDLGGQKLAVAGESGTLVILDSQTGKVIHELVGHAGDVRQVLFHPYQDLLISGGDDGQIIFWSSIDGSKIKEWETTTKIVALAIDPEQDLLVSGGTDHKILIWEISTDEILDTLSAHTDSISAGGLALSPDLQLLASAAYDHTLRIWDLPSRKTVRLLKGHTDRVEAVAFSPDSQIIASSSSDRTIRIWKLQSGETLRVLRGHQNAVLSITFINGGEQLISTSIDRTLRIWDIESGVTLRVLQGHSSAVTDSVYNNGLVFSSENNGQINVWNTRDNQNMKIFDVDTEPLSVAISPDGKSIATGYTSGNLTLHSLPDFDVIWELNGAHGNYINRLDFSPDGQMLASGSYDNTIRVWRTSDGYKLQTFKDHKDAIYCLSFSKDGERLASAGFDGRVGIFDMLAGENRFIRTRNRKNYSISFNSDGTKLVSSGDDNKIKLWDLKMDPPNKIQTFIKSQNLAMWSAISPNGKIIASVGRDVSVNLFNTKTGKVINSLVGHENTIYRVEFCPDGTQIITASADGTLRMWDLQSQTELFSLRLPTNSGWPIPLWDFDFFCSPSVAGGNNNSCLIAVPLYRGKLVLFDLANVYKFK